LHIILESNQENCYRSIAYYVLIHLWLERFFFFFVLDPPTVTVEQPFYSVTTDNSVTLVCSVTSNLLITSIEWQRNVGGTLTTITSNTNTNTNSGSTITTLSVTIFSAASSDAGTYICFASNSVGIGQSTTTLSVTGSRCQAL
jgi:hypothetical protein